ncbi:MAG: hypothetical protein ACK5IQ_03080 [Bacteroidales bacterium]
MNRCGIIGNKKEVLDSVSDIKKKCPELLVSDMFFLDKGVGEQMRYENIDDFVRNNEAVIISSPMDNIKDSIIKWAQYETPIYIDFFPILSKADIDLLARVCVEAQANVIVRSVYPYALSMKSDLNLGDNVQCVNFQRNGVGDLICKTEILKDLVSIINLLGHKIKTCDVTVYKNKIGKEKGYIVNCVLSCYGFYKANLLWNIASLGDTCRMDIYTKDRYLNIDLIRKEYRTEPTLPKHIQEDVEYKKKQDIVRFFNLISKGETENSFMHISEANLVADKIFSKL